MWLSHTKRLSCGTVAASTLYAAAALPLACIFLTVERLFAALHMIGSPLFNIFHSVARLIDVLLAILANHAIVSFSAVIASQRLEWREVSASRYSNLYIGR